jgi:hypothetical protein
MNSLRMRTQNPRITFRNNGTIFATREECHNDIGHELIDNNNMIYLPLYIVTRNVYYTTRELTS